MNSSAAALLNALKRQLNGRNLCLVVGLALLALMIWAAHPAVLWSYAVQMRWCLPAVVAVWGVGYLLNTCSWGSIVRTNALREPLPFGRLFRFTVTGFAINYVTPFGLLGGEPYRIVELRRYLGLEQASGSVILYMMMHICSHFIFWVTTCLLVVMFVPGLSAGWTWGLAGVALLCVGGIYLFFSGYRSGVLARLLRVVRRWPLIGRRVQRLSPETHQRLALVDSNISNLLTRHPRAFASSLALEYLSRMVNSAEVYLLLLLLGMPATAWGAVVVVGLSSLLANILFFSPLQLGTREGGILLAMQVVYPQFTLAELMPVAVAVSLMTRVREFIWIAIGLLFLRIQNKTRQTAL